MGYEEGGILEVGGARGRLESCVVCKLEFENSILFFHVPQGLLLFLSRLGFRRFRFLYFTFSYYLAIISLSSGQRSGGLDWYGINWRLVWSQSGSSAPLEVEGYRATECRTNIVRSWERDRKRIVDLDAENRERCIDG